MKIDFDIIMNSNERETIENFIDCLNEYCSAMKDCDACKFDALRSLNGACPIDDGWINGLLREG